LSDDSVEDPSLRVTLVFLLTNLKWNQKKKKETIKKCVWMEVSNN
jgi:hypothetical protein